MKDCSDCGNVQRAGQDSYACKMGNSTYLINNYPEDGKDCVAWRQGQTQKTAKETKRDPLLSWLNRANKERERQDSHDIQPVVDEGDRKIIESFEKNAKEVGIEVPTIPTQAIIPQQTIPDSDGEVNVKNALGWLVAAVLSGVLISLWLLGLL